MKLYMHPASTTCRPIMMFIADHQLPVEQEVVDIMTGEQYGPAFTAINPNNFVPVLDPYKLADATGQQQAVAAGKTGAERFLGILNDHIIGTRAYLCDDRITIADYFASGILSLGNVIGCAFAAYPNVARWYATMRTLPNWQAANAGIDAWADFARGPAYVTV